MGLEDLMSKMGGKKGTILGSMQDDIGKDVAEKIFKQVQPFIKPMMGAVENFLGADEKMIMIRRQGDKTVLFIIDVEEIQKFEVNEKGVLKSLEISNFVEILMTGGASELFNEIESEINEAQK
jgi:hypothetical protein